MSNNPPDKIVELTQEQYEFMLRNCDKNIEFGINCLQHLDRPAAVKMVAIVELFKEVREALRIAK